MPEFFFDTADYKDIFKIWNKLKPYNNSQSVLGITTNPNALSKINCGSLTKLEILLPILCSTVSEMREGPGGVVYVQIPNDGMCFDDIIKWATYISKLSDDVTKIALKVPPYIELLTMLKELPIELNVTGIADAYTALSCLSFSYIKYVSIIPGRMEEVGIDANVHLKYLQQNHLFAHQKVIAGSMRTPEGLVRAIKYGTVPTIGMRVWNLFKEEDFVNFKLFWELPSENIDPVPLPIVDERNYKLSKDFFTQMNELGKPLYDQFMQESKWRTV